MGEGANAIDLAKRTQPDSEPTSNSYVWVGRIDRLKDGGRQKSSNRIPQGPARLEAEQQDGHRLPEMQKVRSGLLAGQ